MTATTCFFCQNLLSDYVEEVLPASRHQELKAHLQNCTPCEIKHSDLLLTLSLLKTLTLPPVTHETILRITEASQAGTSQFLTRERLSRASLILAIPILIVATLFLAFPNIFPWRTWISDPNDDLNFARYYPLLQGAAEIVEEQSNWLHAREPLVGSVWEEGGLSPEEFEKSFQIKGGKEEEK